ncbi:MAG: hypothetical protein P8074_24160 [Anaerolineales bacterium]
MVVFLIFLFLSACQPLAASTDTASSAVDTAASEAEVAPAPDTAPSEAEGAPAPDTAASEDDVSATPETARTLDDKIANAMSAGPAAIAEDATILDYPQEWPGNWPDEPAPELIEIRAGTNGWTCIVDIPDTPGNDPMCLNGIYLDVLLAQRNLVDSPSTGVGLGYMLQGGGPIGSPPHMMVFVPESNKSFDAFGTEPGPFPWIMYPETSNQHLMVLAR